MLIDESLFRKVDTTLPEKESISNTETSTICLGFRKQNKTKQKSLYSTFGKFLLLV